jgi:FKBP-type peptidyl-prolyl cis-trans isomerase FkpA
MRNNIQMNKNTIKYTFALLGILVLFNSCKKEYETIQSIDDAKIQAYIKQNNLTMTKDPSGYYYQVLSQGTGAPMLNKDSVFYNLDIKSLGGKSYFTTPAYSNDGTYLGYLIPASYQTALVGVNRGSKVRVILPSYLAYGKNGNANVPSNEIIVSDITTLNETAQWQIDDKTIKSFLTAKGITAVKNPNRIYFTFSQVGTGTIVDALSSVTVKYTGKFLNGNIFDQTSGDATFVTTLDQVIVGWKKALVGLNKGTKVRIFIPSDLAYGTAGSTTSAGVVVIPPSSVLDFEIEIVDVTN